MIRAVVFDMDGVLFDTERLTKKSWETVGGQTGYADVTKLTERCMGANAQRVRQIFLEEYGADFPYESFMQKVRDCSSKFIAENGLPVKPGVRELLRYLKRNGFHTAVATSTGRERALQYFELTGITGFFDRIICGDMLEKSKPEPDIYLKAAAALGVPPKDCMAIEDSPNGITSAFRAGMKTVMVPDLVEPTSTLRGMLFACVPALNGVVPLLERERKEAGKKTGLPLCGTLLFRFIVYSIFSILTAIAFPAFCSPISPV